jgi:hypothetical protein
MAAEAWGATTSGPARPRSGFAARTDWHLPALVSLTSSRPLAEGLHHSIETQRTFAALAEEWRQETAHLSSVTEIALHPAYQRVIGMGRAALPLILAELARQPDHWFWALRAITGENPVTIGEAGDVLRMRQAWLRLGRRRGWVGPSWTS